MLTTVLCFDTIADYEKKFRISEHFRSVFQLLTFCYYSTTPLAENQLLKERNNHLFWFFCFYKMKLEPALMA